MPEDFIKVKVGKNDEELFMSFGLLNELLKLVDDIPMVSAIGINGDLREKVLEIVFSPRDEKGAITSTITMPEIHVSKADVIRVLEWVAGHCLDFFLEAAEASVRASLPHQDRLLKLMPSGSGSAS